MEQMIKYLGGRIQFWEAELAKVIDRPEIAQIPQLLIAELSGAVLQSQIEQLKEGA